MSEEIFGHYRSRSQCFQGNRSYIDDIFRIFFINLRYILYIPLKGLLIFLKSSTSTCYFSNSNGSSVTSGQFSPSIVLQNNEKMREERWVKIHELEGTRVRGHFLFIKLLHMVSIKGLMLGKWSYKLPPIVLTIEPWMVIVLLARNQISFKHVSFWYPSIFMMGNPYLVTYLNMAPLFEWYAVPRRHVLERLEYGVVKM